MNEGKAMDAALDTMSAQRDRINEQVILIGLLEAENARLESLLHPSKHRATTRT